MAASRVGAATGFLVVAGAVTVLYAALVWLLRDFPLALALFGNAVLAGSGALVAAVVWKRRGEWAGCQRLFWSTIGVGLALWLIGQLGWAFHEIALEDRAWLRWHTLFRVSGGVAPLIALLARPSRGIRSDAVATAAIDLTACGLVVIFVYAYFVLAPTFLPAAGIDPQPPLFDLVRANHLLLLGGLLAGAWLARRTNWQGVYVLLASGVAAGLVLRIGRTEAMASAGYQTGSVHDLALVVPWLAYAWAAAIAPPSPHGEATLESHGAQSPVFSVVPVLLIPVIGYGHFYFQDGGTPLDSFRALLTGVLTVCGLSLLALRLAVQRSELQRADARLRLLAAATEQTGDLILITRADGRFEHANDAFLRALGYTRQELLLLRFTDLIQNGTAAHVSHIPEAVARDGIWRGTLLRRRRDGTTFPASCTVAALRNAAGVITHFVGVERDVSDELRLRDKLVHSERLSAIGELVAGVAHEINNPLQTIVGCVELMLDDRAGGVSRRDLEVVRREAARAGQIVRNLLSFVRRSAPDRALTDLNQLVRTTVALREYHLRLRNIAIDAQYATAPLPIMANRDEIQQVVLNLLLNAEHAIAGSASTGTITVRTSAAGAGQIVEVTDTGPGIDPELRGRVFEPFFTTKEVGEGSGLGLSISHGIASAHGGSLELHDSTSGARFRLTLPACAEPAARGAGPVPPAGARRALVVDDESAIRRLMVRLLERRGFDVVEVEIAEAALSLADSVSFDVVFCDVRMPGVSGFELYRRLVQRDESLSGRFIFITGDTTSPEHARRDVAHLPVLAKPFTAADLDAVLARIGVTAQPDGA